MRRAICAVGIAVAVCLVGVAPASGEVAIDPAVAVRGARTAFTLELSNGRPDQGTVRIEITIPDGVYALDASPTEGTGFSPVVTYRELAPPLVTPSGTVIERVVERITWTGGPSARSGFFELVFGLGPIYTELNDFPLPVVQTYEDASTDSWVELVTPGQGELAFAAPVVVATGELIALTPDPTASVPASNTESTVGTAGLEVEAVTDDGGSPFLAILGLLLVVGFVAGGAVFAARRAARRNSHF